MKNPYTRVRPLHLHITKYNIFHIKRLLANNNIKASEVRVVDETGKQLGVMKLSEALQIATGRNLDLVQVTEKVDPPVCKIVQLGKYLYSEQKKKKEAKSQSGQLKQVRITFAISIHDMETRVKQAEKFLTKGNRVMVEMRLRGRERALREVAKGKMNQFLEILQKATPIRVDRQIKSEPRGLSVIIVKG
ncbi:translation initiation factor IF-3 [Patescibacteria group bacterium]